MSEELKSALPTGSLQDAAVTFFRKEAGSRATCALSYTPTFRAHKLALTGKKVDQHEDIGALSAVMHPTDMSDCGYSPSPKRETTNEIIYNYGIA